MPGKHYPYIARESWALIFILFVLGIVAHLFVHGLAAIIVWLFIPAWAYLYRDPERSIPAQPLAVVSPVDASVVAIEMVPNPYIEGDALRIELEMSCLDLFRIRSPIEGKVLKSWFLLPGDPLPLQQGAVGNLRISHWIQTDEGDNIVITIRKKARLSRPQCDIQTGERIGQGQRCGMVQFGAGIDIYVPPESRLEIAIGDKVKSGSQAIAQLPTHTD